MRHSAPDKPAGLSADAMINRILKTNPLSNSSAAPRYVPSTQRHPAPSTSQILSVASFAPSATASPGTFRLRPESIPEEYRAHLRVVGATPDTNKVYQLLLQSGLPRPTLGYVWSLANRTVPGQLSQEEFFIALAMTALAQQRPNMPFTVESLAHFPVLPIPHFPASQPSTPNAPPPPPHVPPSTSLPSVQQPDPSPAAPHPLPAPPVVPPSAPQPQFSATLPPLPTAAQFETAAPQKAMRVPSDQFGDFVEVTETPTPTQQPVEKVSSNAASLMDLDFGIMSSDTASCSSGGETRTEEQRSSSNIQTRESTPKPDSAGSADQSPAILRKVSQNQDPLGLPRSFVNDDGIITSENHESVWERIIIAATELLRQSQDVLLDCEDRLRPAVISSPRGQQHRTGLVEVVKVVNRIHATLKTNAFQSKAVENALEEYLAVWPEIMIAWSLERDSVKESSEANMTDVCGICLQPLYPPTVRSGGIFHAPCANLWVNRVELTLPQPLQELHLL